MRDESHNLDNIAQVTATRHTQRNKITEYGQLLALVWESTLSSYNWTTNLARREIRLKPCTMRECIAKQCQGVWSQLLNDKN